MYDGIGTCLLVDVKFVWVALLIKHMLVAHEDTCMYRQAGRQTSRCIIAYRASAQSKATK